MPAFTQEQEALINEIKSAQKEMVKRVEALPDHLKTNESIEKLNKLIDEKEASLKAISTRLEAAETKLNRPGLGDGNGLDTETKLRKSLASKGFITMLRSKSGLIANAEEKSAYDAETKALYSDADHLGGYLCPPEFVAEIIKAEVEISPIMQYVNVRNTDRASVQIPSRTQTMAAVRRAQRGTLSETQNPNFGLETITPDNLEALCAVSWEDLEDSQFNLEMFLRDEAAEQFALSEGREIVLGTGDAGQAEGFTINTAVEKVLTATNDVYAADDVLTLYYSLKTAYLNDARFCANRAIIRETRKFKSDTGQYLWEPGLNGSASPLLCGKPIIELPDMASSVADAALILAFGNFRRGYTWVNRIQSRVIRDEVTRKKEGIVEFMFHKRSGGQVTLADAIKILKVQ